MSINTRRERRPRQRSITVQGLADHRSHTLGMRWIPGLTCNALIRYFRMCADSSAEDVLSLTGLGGSVALFDRCFCCQLVPRSGWQRQTQTASFLPHPWAAITQSSHRFFEVQGPAVLGEAVGGIGVWDFPYRLQGRDHPVRSSPQRPAPRSCILHSVSTNPG